MGTAVVAVGHSFAARGGMEVFDRVRPGGVIQVGDHAGGLGVRHKRDLRPAAVRADQPQARGSDNKSTCARSVLRVAHAVVVRARRQVPSRRA